MGRRRQAATVWMSAATRRRCKAFASADARIQKKPELMLELLLSGYQDSNLGPPAPKAGALTGLRYTPKMPSFLKCNAKVRSNFQTSKFFCNFF